MGALSLESSSGTCKLLLMEGGDASELMMIYESADKKAVKCAYFERTFHEVVGTVISW